MGLRRGLSILIAAGILASGGTAFADITFADSWETGAGNNVSLTSGPDFPVTGTSGGELVQTFIINAIFEQDTGFVHPNLYIYFGNISNNNFVLTSVGLSEDGSSFTQLAVGKLLNQSYANSAYVVNLSSMAVSARDSVEQVQIQITLSSTAESYVQITGVSNPEPATLTLFAAGLGASAFASYRRRRKRRAAGVR
jgi:hypothetical protein